MADKNQKLVRCPTCGIPFFKISRTRNAFTFLKWFGGSMKETFVMGKIDSFICPKCLKLIEISETLEKPFDKV
jgi:hypothetical protein